MLHAYFYTICFMFCYTSWHFYAFSGTNLLTRCHGASSLFFCYFCVSEKLHRKYSWNWTKQKPNHLIFTKASRRPKRRRRGATGQPHHRVAWPAPGPPPNTALWLLVDGARKELVPSWMTSPLGTQEEVWWIQQQGFLSVKKPRFIDQERSKQTTEGDAC
jgi:hypothetical protein